MALYPKHSRRRLVHSTHSCDTGGSETIIMRGPTCTTIVHAHDSMNITKESTWTGLPAMMTLCLWGSKPVFKTPVPRLWSKSMASSVERIGIPGIRPKATGSLGAISVTSDVCAPTNAAREGFPFPIAFAWASSLASVSCIQVLFATAPVGNNLGFGAMATEEAGRRGRRSSSTR